MKVLLFVFLFFAFFSSCSKIPEDEKKVNKTCFKFASLVRKQKKLYLAGFGQNMDTSNGTYKVIALTFGSQEKIKDIETARKLIVEIISEFITYLNHEKSIQDYLTVTPLTVKNLDIGNSIEQKNINM